MALASLVDPRVHSALQDIQTSVARKLKAIRPPPYHATSCEESRITGLTEHDVAEQGDFSVKIMTT